jgi:hypothetical protein
MATPHDSFRAFLSRSSSPRLSAPEARTLLSNAWAAVIGIVPKSRTSALLTAHWALETDGGRCMPGHNFAGIKAAPNAPGQSFATVEGHGASRRVIHARFRAYENPEAGALDYVKLLATRYPDAVAAANVGDSGGFVRALAKGGYFTAAPDAYATALEWRLATPCPGIHGQTFAPRPAPGALARAALEGLLHLLRAPSERC